MEDFFKFLKCNCIFLKELSQSPTNVHIVLGNEACDLDSTIACLVFGYFLSKQHCNSIILPVLNVSREDFLIRTENIFVLKEAEIPLSELIFRDEINLQTIIFKYPVQVTLVDHHILAKNDSLLAPFVCQIYDHRPVDESFQWDTHKVQIIIEQVGSCCTLIAQDIFKADKSILPRPLAYLIYQTIVFDTIALKPENHKVTPLDLEIATLLECEYGFTSDRQQLFDVLWQAHNDVSSLTPDQLLQKDLKIFEKVYIPGLPMLVEEYLKLKGSFESVESFAEKYEAVCLLLVGLKASDGRVQRDFAVFTRNREGKSFEDSLLRILKSNENYDFMMEERKTVYEDKITLFHTHNTKLSRKQLFPLIRKAWQCYVHSE
ncbi:hypothetical protein ABEB36_000879 [Hypothenemus hampei]|uniref:DHHA2 domain-containing protein n=1 Tax=Hypothenemus hampei TaxID=57062 RepID=A0ABD1FCQ9_HYPHA